MIGSKEPTNGINAMLAHTMRSGDDNNFVRSIVESYMFLGFGIVTAITGERMKVYCGDRNYTNVELMVLGVDGWGLKMLPAVNDRVLLLSTQIPVHDLKTFTASGNMPPYDQSGIKAIPLTDTTASQLFTVTKNGIELTGNVKLTVNDSGIRVEDKNGNIINTTSTGIKVTDKNNNIAEATSSGISITDANSSTAVMSNSGITITDEINKAGNKKSTVKMTSAGVEIDDNQGNSIVLSGSGIAITDNKNASGANKNSIAMTSSGVTINDKNGNSIVMGTSNVTINGKLEIGR